MSFFNVKQDYTVFFLQIMSVAIIIYSDYIDSFHLLLQQKKQTHAFATFYCEEMTMET